MQDALKWVIEHQGLLSGLAVLLIDYIVGKVPSLSGNNILNQLELWLKGIASKNPPSQ